jgi:hypothetical protein
MKHHSNKKAAILGAGLGLLLIGASGSVANADTPLDPIVCDVTGTVGLDLLCPGNNPLPDLPTPPLPIPPGTLPELPVKLPALPVELPSVTLPQLPIGLPEVNLPPLTLSELPAVTLPDLQGGSVGGAASGAIEVTAPGVAVDAAGGGEGSVSTSCDQPATVDAAASGAVVANVAAPGSGGSGGGDGGLSLPETAGLLAVVLTVVKTVAPKVLSVVTSLLG